MPQCLACGARLSVRDTRCIDGVNLASEGMSNIDGRLQSLIITSRSAQGSLQQPYDDGKPDGLGCTWLLRRTGGSRRAFKDRNQDHEAGHSHSMAGEARPRWIYHI